MFIKIWPFFYHFSSLIHFDHIYKLVQECNRNGSHPLIGVICHLGSPHQPARHQNCAICVVIPSGKSKTAPIFPMSTQHNINFKMCILRARHQISNTQNYNRQIICHSETILLKTNRIFSHVPDWTQRLGINYIYIFLTLH